MSFTDVFTGDVVQPTDVSQTSISLAAANTTLTWPVPRIVDVTGAAGVFNVILPDATLASVGQDILFNNLSAGAFNVLANDGITVVASFTAGQSKYLYLQSNTTSNGTWGSVVMGGSVSAATAAALQGMGVFAIGTTLNAAINVSAVSAGFTVNQATDRAKLFVWNGSGGTIALPPAATAGANFFFMLRNDGTGTVTVDPSAGQTINNALTFDMPQGGNSAIIVCDGTEWYTVGYGQNVDFGYTAISCSVTGLVSSPSSIASIGWTSQMFITLTGTLGLNLELTLPDTPYLYVIKNNVTMGAFTLTVRTTTGTGYALTASETMVLWSDGANMSPGVRPTPLDVNANAIAYAVALG